MEVDMGGEDKPLHPRRKRKGASAILQLGAVLIGLYLFFFVSSLLLTSLTNPATTTTTTGKQQAVTLDDEDEDVPHKHTVTTNDNDNQDQQRFVENDYDEIKNIPGRIQLFSEDPCFSFGGILHTAGKVCCSAACGDSCGSMMCRHGAGGAASCCAVAILKTAQECEAGITMAPCILPKDSQIPTGGDRSTVLPPPMPANMVQAPGVSTHECHRSTFTHHCMSKQLTLKDGVLVAHDPSRLPAPLHSPQDSLEQQRDAVQNMMRLRLELPSQLSPRYNKPKVMQRRPFQQLMSAHWTNTLYQEDQCTSTYDVPTYVFELYFTTNFFHIINDNLLPLYATIEAVEGVGAVQQTRARQIVYHDSTGVNKPDHGLHAHLQKWLPFMHRLSDRPPVFWKSLQDFSVRGQTICFRHISFNLVDIVHLLHPIESLGAEELATRTGVLQRFRATTYEAFNASLPRDSESPCGSSPSLGAGSQLTLISRKQGGPRHVTNEQDLLEVATKLGLVAKALVVDGMGFGEQLEHYARSCVFVASHGAGVMNALFLPPNARVIQVFSYSLRYDYAKSSIDCGTICYRGQYVREMSQMMYGEGRYGEVAIPLNDTHFDHSERNHRDILDPFTVWAINPKVAIEVLIKGTSEFVVNPIEFERVLASVMESKGETVEVGELPPVVMDRLSRLGVMMRVYEKGAEVPDLSSKMEEILRRFPKKTD